MNKKFFANSLSYIFNPLIFFLLMPYLVVYKQTADTFAAFRWGIFSTAFIFVGGLLLLVGKRRGTFSDFDLSNRGERAKFYFLLWPLVICYIIASFTLRGMFFSLSIIAIGIIIGLLLFELVNTRVKASIHIGVATSFVITIGFLFGWTAFLQTIFIIPLLAWSRLFLKRHTPPEIFTGGVLGIIITGVTFLIAKILL